MGKVINVTSRLSNDKNKVEINGKEYEVNNTLGAVKKFEACIKESTIESIMAGFETVLGKKAMQEIKIDSFNMEGIKVLTIAIMAALQGVGYEEIEARFQK